MENLTGDKIIPIATIAIGIISSPLLLFAVYQSVYYIFNIFLLGLGIIATIAVANGIIKSKYFPNAEFSDLKNKIDTQYSIVKTRLLTYLRQIGNREQ